ncbi:MAG: hypothetical protein Q7T73_06790, partial [Beijerinckiaceae bacterium]|nr:hypothetical protein [Beijerinckiaceae bacterium]
MRVLWPLAAGALFCVGIILSLIALANAFDGVRLPFYGTPADGCVAVSDDAMGQLSDVSTDPLNGLLIAVTGSALVFGLIARRALIGRAGIWAQGILLVAGISGALLSR